MISSNGVLVDSSVWIDFFKNAEEQKLTELLEADLVCTNQLILTELLPVLLKNNHHGAVEGLLAIPVVPLEIDWLILQTMQLKNLDHGINKVGIPDLIILQQVIEKKLTFFSYGKHFKLMSQCFAFELMN